MPVTLTLLISILLFALFALGASFNVKSLWMTYIRKEPYPSIVPLFPGLVGAAALAVFPLYPLGRFAWIPPILDLGCLPSVAAVCAYLAHDWWITNPLFLVSELYQHTSEEVMVVRLYRTGQFRAKKKNLIPPPKNLTKPHWLSVGTGGTWSVTENELHFSLGTVEVVFERNPAGEYCWKTSSGETMLDHTDLQVRLEPH